MKEVKIKQAKTLPTNSLSKDPNHPRQNNGDLESLTQSARHKGFLTEIIVRKISEDNYLVIDGNRRLEVAKLIGITEVSCIVYEQLNDEESAQMSYTLNTERNHLNPIERALHIKWIRDKGGYTYDELEIMGYGSKSQISKLLGLLELPSSIQDHIESEELTPAHGEALKKLTDPEKIKNAAKLAIANEWSAKTTGNKVDKILRKNNKKTVFSTTNIPKIEIPGVYFKDAENMSELPDGSISLIATSPPYHVGMQYEIGYTFFEHMENIRKVMKECARVLVTGGIMAINVADILKFKGEEKKPNPLDRVKPMLHLYQSFLRKHKVYLQDQIIWHKDSNPFTRDASINYTEKTIHTQYRIVNRHEPIYIFRKQGERSIPCQDTVLASQLTREEWKMYAPSVWKIDCNRKTEGHPNVFPDELVRRLIKMYSFEGETVLDPFLGSGTTVKIAKELGRDAVGYERDLRYKETIMEKLGITKPPGDQHEPISKFVKRTLEENEASQPTEPKCENMMSEGMEKKLDSACKEKELENA